MFPSLRADVVRACALFSFVRCVRQTRYQNLANKLNLFGLADKQPGITDFSELSTTMKSRGSYPQTPQRKHYKITDA